ncbi:MFS transporter [Ilumatobacter nonamiensis]|uniref:MFS transporter n=1 Tax=Ilumatobacter nonamiensis TaxID=467093 RepID=UPI0011D24AD3|nr:MFS transporter [Ilumatobacter nonamiensis]
MTTTEEPIEETPGAIASFRSVWRHTRWRWLLGSTVVSLAGDFLYWVAIAVYFTEHDDATFWIAASLIARLLPYVVLSPFGGAVADRFDRRASLVLLDVVRGGLFVVMAVIVAVDGSPAFVLGVLVLISAAGAIYRPARVAAIPQLVPENDIAAANAGEEGLAQLSWFVGPALGAVLVTVLDPSIVLVINAATFVVSALMVARIGNVGGGTANSTESGGSVSSLLADVRAGGRLIAGNRGLCGLSVMTTAASLAFGAEQVLYVSVAADRLDLGAEGIGYLLAAMGVGGLIAAPIAARVGNSAHAGGWLLGSGLLVSLPLVLIAFTDLTPVVLGLAAVEGGAAIVFEVVALTLLQRAVAESMMGRVYSVFDAVGALGQTVGSAGAPVLVSIAGLTFAMQVSGVVAIVMMVVLAPAVLALARTTDQSRRRHRSVATWLGQIPELASFEPIELERLARSSGDRSVAAGEDVIREGDAPDKLYVVRSGALLVVTTQQSAGTPPPELGPHDVFGEIGLLRNTSRTATVTAVTAAEVLEIDGAVFTSIATPSADATAPLLGGMRTRLSRTHPHLAAGDEPPDRGIESASVAS